MTTRRMPLSINCAGLFSSSATNVPNELEEARAAYQRARTGNAVQFAPTELLAANRALAEAEQSFQRDPESRQTRDLAHLAQRLSEVAEATASVALRRESQSGEGRVLGEASQSSGDGQKERGMSLPEAEPSRSEVLEPRRNLGKCRRRLFSIG